MIPAPERSAALRALASLVATTPAATEALRLWPEEVPPRMHGEIGSLPRRLRLGMPAPAALRSLTSFGPDAETLAILFSLHAQTGAALPPMLRGLAEGIDQRERVARSGAAASAGARLSGRMVAGLPLLFVPLVPAAGAPLLDPPGLLILTLGLALAMAGLRWISSLVPQPPQADAVAVVSDVLAAMVSGGASHELALGAMVDAAPESLRTHLVRARRRHALGLGWPAALAMSEDEGVRQLGASLRRSVAYGLPAADGLRELARERRTMAAHAFEALLRRAPVKMVLPLTLCVLPGYGFLALAPFLRGMAHGM